ncbi:MAG TPA: MMPL family transporter [Flavobacteriales bacterium]|nr:MMPL family transporter [Flavobacteriales bacterium]
MWSILARIIIRKRWFILLLLLGLTGMFGYYTTKMKLSRELTDLLPPTDTNQIIFKKMRQLFGEEGMVIAVGIKDKDLYTPKKFKSWYDLGNELKDLEGVDSVFSEANMYYLVLDTAKQDFVLRKTFTKYPSTQAELDSLKAFTRSQPFYENIMFNDSTGVSLMMVFVNVERFNSQQRGNLIPNIMNTAEKYRDQFAEFHFSGLPLIRDVLFRSLRDELLLFVVLSVIASAIILYVFFRSFTVLFICMLTIVMGLVWSFGTMGLLGYKVTALMSLIPPLMIIIAIPNCIYLINKYHQEYLRSKNKLKALTMVIYKLGAATFITNANTALGFLTFVFTGNNKLMEFGIATSFNVMAMFFISLTFIPILFTFMPPPSVRHTKHLDKKWSANIIARLTNLILYRRKLIYVSVFLLTAGSAIGIFYIRTTGNIASDLPADSPVVTDLKFFEKESGGIMPMEIVIDSKEKGQITKDKTLHKIDSIQQYLKKDSIYSKSISIVDAVKVVNQAMHGGDPAYYAFMEQSDKRQLLRYREKLKDRKGTLKSFVDSTETLTRITATMADIGSVEIVRKQKVLLSVIDSILNPDKASVYKTIDRISRNKLKGDERIAAVNALFEENNRFRNRVVELIAGSDTSARYIELDENPDLLNQEMLKPGFDKVLMRAYKGTAYDVQVTGTSTLFAKGTNYMIDDMVQSLIFAILTISALMFFLFTSARMIIISLVPNIIPQIMIAGLMGLFDLPIKPSTILVFSLAYGISVDNSIHFLAKYRQELKAQHFNIKQCVIVSLRETFLSQVYTSVVLLLGFSMFCFSSFGATVALGILVSLSLFIAMFCNLIVLPALLLSLDRYIAVKAYQEPFLSIYDEEEDIDLSELEIKKPEEELPLDELKDE